ncbi:GNL3L/Grn1 putative GTPase-domain-containing protein [Flagelloscypha sp. PMI_526]|nr:GNL3L/Grn1 putative GTPase-domain-containing protein [Flagelloscypha sp. PMI_526]
MPRIRKKTSNRGTTNDRRKVINKVRESRKKKSKAAKKNPQWKSKQKKDPGIPSNFPFKDQILAEVQEERRRAAEEKERRKEAKRLRKIRGCFSPTGQWTFKMMPNLLRSKTPGPSCHWTKDDDEEVPLLANPDLPNLLSVIEEADIRGILWLFGVQSWRRLVATKDKKIIFVLNKIDLCPREVVSAWLNHLRSIHPTSSQQGKQKPSQNKKPLVIAITGVTNGRLHLLNSLLKSNSAPVYSLGSSPRGATTSVPSPRGATQLRFIDTPGISWETTILRARDILLRNRGRIDRLKDPLPPVAHIISRANPDDLMLLYNLPAFESRNLDSFVAGVARASQLVKKAHLTIAGACRIVLHDWHSGKLAWYTQPPSSSPTEPLSKEVASILNVLVPRKELRKSGKGIVKLVASSVESRNVDLERLWTEEEDSDASDEENEEEEGFSISAPLDTEQDSSESDEDEESEEEVAPLPPVSHKQKRKRADPEDGDREEAPQQKKKVSFAADPKESKVARKAGSLKAKAKPKKPLRSTSKSGGAEAEEGYDFSKFF